MEFIYSEEVSPRAYDTHELANGIPLRLHKDAVKEAKGALRAQGDWNQHVSSIEGYLGGLGDPYSFIRVTVPECRPERLEVISYANEFAFLYDDEMENLDFKSVAAGTEGILDTFGETVLDTSTGPNIRPEKRLQAQILLEMSALDPQRAIVAMKAWATFVQLASRTRDAPIGTLSEYIKARVIDAGELFWFGILTFGMALTIPDEEYDLCMELARPGYTVLGLVNDLYSWRKERDAAEKAGQDYVFNAIWVIMRERSVGEDEAKDICADEIRRYTSEYQKIVEATREDAGLTKDTRAYLEAVMFSCVDETTERAKPVATLTVVEVEGTAVVALASSQVIQAAAGDATSTGSGIPDEES